VALIFKEEALALGILKYEDEAENESGRSMPPRESKYKISVYDRYSNLTIVQVEFFSKWVR
jgi:hypothetical protein